MDFVEKMRMDEVLELLETAKENPIKWGNLYPIHDSNLPLNELIHQIDQMMEFSHYSAVMDIVMHNRVNAIMSTAIEMLVYQKIIDDIRDSGIENVVRRLQKYLVDANFIMQERHQDEH